MVFLNNEDSDVVAAEIEARDACHWLLAAGFPQYVQLYEGASPCIYHYYFAPLWRGANYCCQRVCPLAYLNTMSKLYDIFVHVICGHSLFLP